MLLLYNFFIRLYYLGIVLATAWNKKAKQWLMGRKSWFEQLEKQIKPNNNYVWVHCSSAGEFEQGKPICEALKNTYPRHKLLITFFSPSGYSTAIKYKEADIISYLPLDTKKNANRFIGIVKPQLAIFIKYELWYHHLSAAAFHELPLLLTSAVFRKEQFFFKPYGGFFRSMLRSFQHIFVQDETSMQLLNSIGVSHCSLSGDTRFDRVKEISSGGAEVPFISAFLQNKKCIVAGSTWSEDEKLLRDFIAVNSELKLIVAPHEINQIHLAQLRGLFPEAVMYSSFSEEVAVDNGRQVLIVDSVGLLSRLYQHATITYVGGGFTQDGVHNVLEAAVWEKPVVFGPNYKKYREARELIEEGGGFSVSDKEKLEKWIDNLLSNGKVLQEASEKAKHYVDKNTGATEKILRFIQENRLLTKL